MDIASKAARAAGGLAVCAAGGAVLAVLHVPLPWMIGSMLGMAVARMAGARVEPLPHGRDAGLMIVGTALGLHFTAPVVHEVASYWPWFVALGFSAIGFGTVSGYVLERLSGIDRTTAYFGMMPGGASEMAMMGERHGAAPDRVAFAHSMRMLLVVTSFPVAITLAGFHATDDYNPVAIAFDAPRLALLFAMAAGGGWAARRLGLPTAYMMGSLIVTTALTVSDVSLSSVPRPFSNAAQVLLGGTLGYRFDRAFLRSAPRFAAALLPSIAVTLASAVLVGCALAWASGVYLGTGLLASAPGGIAEMSITAQVLRIGVAFVTAAHVVRYVIVVLFTGPVFRLLNGRRR